MTESNNTCEVCSEPARQFCSSCRAVFYCSRECQKQDWKNHKAKCKPIVVLTHATYGRYVVATRDIKAGEVILNEAPLVIGPKQRGHPVCLGCHKGLMNTIHFCSSCSYPLCGKSCENSKYHKFECAVLGSSGKKIPFDKEKMNLPHHAYDCITPLRCVLTKTTDPNKWDIINSLQSNYDQMVGTDVFKVNENNTINFLRKHLNWDGADDKTIHRMCGILITNAFEICHNGQRIRGLYPQAAMFSHSCVPNTKHTVDEDLNVIFRTTVPILKGNPVTITYTNTLWNTVARRKQLKQTKHFWCCCPRCADPEELGTCLSTLLCAQCGGNINCTDPLVEDAPWMCEKCSHTLKASQVLWGDGALYQELKDIEHSTPKDLEQFLLSYVTSLHANNRFMVESKYALVKFYGNTPGFTYADMTREQLENKVEYCRQLLKVAEMIDPGKSLLRGTLMFELQASLVATAKYLVSNDIITQQEAGERMTEAVKILQEASEILKHEPELAKGGLDEKLKKLSSDLEL